jgi:biopolymer transport protein ExbD
MATLNIPQNGKATNGRSKKPLPSVDLTAMVDLAFLLITFFMLTTSLSKMKVMEIAKPVPIKELSSLAEWPASRTLTILLGKNNQAIYYLGEAKDAKMQMIDLSAIQKQILASKSYVARTQTDARGQRMLVIIKPTSTSVYKNFVDILDEMHITGVETYAIDDKYILPAEREFMLSKGI